MEVIQFAWGGCGNFIKQCLTSDTTYNKTVEFYTNLKVDETYVSQEWAIRNDDQYVLTHDSINPNGINLVWNNSLDTSFHYILKNITINHLTDNIVLRTRAVVGYNQKLEARLKKLQHVVVDNLLRDSNQLFEFCRQYNPNVELETIKEIHHLWKQGTKKYYDQNSTKVLDYFSQLGLDYSPTNLYNILYANTNT
jgi:hypothetical protein